MKVPEFGLFSQKGTAFYSPKLVALGRNIHKERILSIRSENSTSNLRAGTSPFGSASNFRHYPTGKNGSKISQER